MGGLAFYGGLENLLETISISSPNLLLIHVLQ